MDREEGQALVESEFASECALLGVGLTSQKVATQDPPGS